jgi:hypothetical protein
MIVMGKRVVLVALVVVIIIIVVVVIVIVIVVVVVIIVVVAVKSLYVFKNYFRKWLSFTGTSNRRSTTCPASELRTAPGEASEPPNAFHNSYKPNESIILRSCSLCSLSYPVATNLLIRCNS